MCELLNLQCVAPIYVFKAEVRHLLKKEEGSITYTRSTVFDRFVRYGKFTEIVSRHFGLDLNRIECLKEFQRKRPVNISHIGYNEHATFPLYIPITLPIISGTTIMSRKCVFTTAGFSLGGASIFAFRSFLISASGRRLRPRWNRRRARACTNYVLINFHSYYNKFQSTYFDELNYGHEM